MIKDNIVAIKERIVLACNKVGRDPAEVALVCVSKNRAVGELEWVIQAGITDIGENKVQEALLKYSAIRNTPYASRIKWHMIGHLQTNKTREAVKLFDLIHSVDSLRLAEEINRQAEKINKIQDILIEVNVSGEESKFGLKPGELGNLAKAVLALKNVRLLGLMAMAPAVAEPEKAGMYFRKSRELLEEINAWRGTQGALRVLSMGMSNDFEAAIAEGATLVRIGRLVFDSVI
ncbi:MAG: YggS family pyridoxal phosphate-dependent enzyme [Candidatus Omnitrophota bacterium]